MIFEWLLILGAISLGGIALHYGETGVIPTLIMLLALYLLGARISEQLTWISIQLNLLEKSYKDQTEQRKNQQKEVSRTLKHLLRRR